jgi:anti-anti-sigma regulatory factor
MNNFVVHSAELSPSVAVIHIEGFFSGSAGESLAGTARALLTKGFTKLILEFSLCKIITSPGLAHLLQILMEAIDDFKGEIIFSGLDRQKTLLMDMTGILPMADTAANLEEAKKKLLG